MRRTLENTQISRACSDLLALFDPVAKAVNAMQKRTTTLSECVDIWLQMLQSAPSNAGGYDCLVKRSEQALTCKFFLLANVLDHRYSGAKLRPEQIDLARQFAEEEGPEVVAGLNLYLAQSPPFRPTLFMDKGDPIAWWIAGKMSGFPTPLTDLALRLCGCLATTGNLERLFSTMGHVYGRRRTRLSVAKAGKLTFLYRCMDHCGFGPSEVLACRGGGQPLWRKVVPTPNP